MKQFSFITDRWTQLTGLQQFLFITLGMLLLLGALVYFLLRPLWEEANWLREDINREQIKLAQIIRTRAQIDRFKKELVEMEVRYKQIEIMLPEAAEIPRLLAAVSNLGQQQGLEFLLFKPEKENPLEFVSEIPITLHLKGVYHQFGVFFDHLRRLPRIVNVKQLEMGAFDEKTAQINARCQLVTFRVLPLPAPTEPKGPKPGKK